MNKLFLIALIVQGAFAVNSDGFHSQKLDREWSSDVKYIKDNEWFQSFKSGRSDQFYEGVFSTRIDHFRPQNQQRTNFRYNVNANHLVPNGPLYVYIKDVYDYSTRWIESGLMVDIANQTNGGLFTFNSRYFGVNRPFDSASFEDLELLTVEQSLADIAIFLRYIRQNYGSRVIMWGSGYGAVLAVYARSRYPQLVDGAWSSSGIIEPSVYSYGPFDYFLSTFDLNDNAYCQSLIKNAYDIIAYLVINGEGEYLGQRMNLCQAVDTNSSSDVAALYENTVRSILYYLNEFQFNGVQEFCRDMEAIPGDTLNSFARWLRYVYGAAECFDPSYATQIERTSNTEWDQVGTDSGRRQSYFLQCTQIGGFLLADSYTPLPGVVDLEYHIQKCEDTFGIPFNSTVISNAFYALRAEFDQNLGNVIYTNGMLDPFRYFGRTYDASNPETVLNIALALKSADLTSQSINDRPSLFEAKSVIIENVIRWSTQTEN